MTKKKSDPTVAKPAQELTSQERAAVKKYLARTAANPAPRFKVQDEKVPRLTLDHPDQTIGLVLLMEAIGSADHDFYNGLINQLLNAGPQGRQIDERALNFMLSVIKDIKPRDQVEAMLAAQMAAVHSTMMTFARRLNNVENIPQQDSAERAFNKLARTFASQMEALKRYRTGGEQKVTVQHVSVSEGGQAIVGNVTQAPARTPPSGPAAGSHPALTQSRADPMPIVGESARSPQRVKRKTK